MDTPEKLRGLIEAAGLVPERLWAERPERHWTWPDLVRLGAEYGATKRRLETLDAERQRGCLAQVRREFAVLPSDALVYRPEIIFAVARRA
jgi:hypothetical protein